MNRPTLKLTKPQARAVLQLLDFAWADYEAMTDSDLRSFGMNERWADCARKGCEKLRGMAYPQAKQRGKPFQNGHDTRRANMD